MFGAGTCVAAPKGRYGEVLGAAGALGLASAVAWVTGAAVTGVVEGAAPSRARTCLVTALGFPWQRLGPGGRGDGREGP